MKNKRGNELGPSLLLGREGGAEGGGQDSGEEEVEGTSVLNMDVLYSSSCSG